MGLDAKLERKWKEFQTEVPWCTKQATKYIVELRTIADDIDNYHQGATIANIAGTSTGALGGILTIAGIVAAPFTMGTSLVLTGVGLGAGVLGGVTNIVANITDNLKQNNEQKRVNEIVEQYQDMTKHLTDTLTQLNQVIEFLIQGEERRTPVTNVANAAQGLVSGLGFASVLTTTLTRNAMVTFRAMSGVLAGLTIAWDLFSIVKDVNELGKKMTEISKMIRQIATNMEEEKGNFEKTLLDLKKCDELNNYLVGY
ncbi:apolipoprotein L3-like [Amblyraja radiata]|uniref:apolipoprotein L3-like n=1 Tax=Amblyraja radiata TaxID=386614 RepID=UPI001403129B|nr:apolipoprotein L3-like [Amblyraja radiata]